MTRVLLIVLDSVGCGGAADAGDYGDAGSDTLGHIAKACAMGQCDRPNLRHGILHLPNLVSLGLAHACEASTGSRFAVEGGERLPVGQWGYGVEVSQGKDTPSGHWEMAGCPVTFKWGYFRDKLASFPVDLITGIVAAAGVNGILGNCHASGVEIIERLGAEHMRTGMPIVYTSADSVIQIAAHEESFGLERLYDLCRAVRRHVDPLNIGRVIARPFTGAHGGFVRTANRKDFAVPPPGETILDRLAERGREIVTIGKIGDIFAHRATGEEIKAPDNMAIVDAMLKRFPDLGDGGFCFANLVDFDSDFGHRRDVAGYAACLEVFDTRLPAIRALLRPGDLCIITADHGNDPTWPGTDHTREHVPILAFGPGIEARSIGQRDSFADIAATISKWLGTGDMRFGRPWL
jgi:phosphopentomutase